MEIVIITALGVGGATVLGVILGFLFKKMSHRFSDIILSFASGVMLSAAILGLILPSFSENDKKSILITIAGIFLGAICLNLADRLVPHLHSLMGDEGENHPKSIKAHKVILFSLAIAIHNLPEGIATGVGFATGDVASALTLAGAIALQNIPEGMVIVAPMLSSGISKKKTFIFASATGIIEIVGTFIGYFAASVSAAVLPLALSFAGGTMIYVISDEMIPETHSHGSQRGATYALLAGFCLMLLMDFYLG